MLRLQVGRHVYMRHGGRALARLPLPSPPVKVHWRANSTMNPRDAALAAWKQQEREEEKAKEAERAAERARIKAERQAKIDAEQAAQKARLEQKRMEKRTAAEMKYALKVEARRLKEEKQKRRRARREEKKRLAREAMSEEDKAKMRRKEEVAKKWRAAAKESNRRRADEKAQKKERRKQQQQQQQQKQRKTPKEQSDQSETRARLIASKAPTRAIVLPRSVVPAWMDRSKGGGAIGYKKLLELQEEQHKARRLARLEKELEKIQDIREEEEKLRARKELLTAKIMDEKRLKSIKRSRMKWVYENVAGANLYSAGEAKPVQVVRQDTIMASTTMVTSSTDCELLFGYNMTDSIDGQKGIIQVPGLPPVLDLSVKFPFTLDPDAKTSARQMILDGKFYDAVFQAAALTGRELDMRSLNFVATRAALKDLFDFVAGVQTPGNFSRLNMNIVKNTVFLQRPRRELSEEDEIAKLEARWAKWGHAFEKAITKAVPPYESSCNYMQIVRYRLGYHDCAVMVEVDACKEKPGPQARPAKPPPVGEQEPLVPSSLSFRYEGSTPMPNELAVEIKAVSAASRFDDHRHEMMKYAAEQAWFGRTPWLMVGEHVEGTFKRFQLFETKDLVLEWEKKHQTELRKLNALLWKLRDVAREHKDEAFAIVAGNGKLQVFQVMENEPPISPEYVKRFWKYKDMKAQGRNKAKAKAEPSEDPARREEAQAKQQQQKEKFEGRKFKGW